MQYKELAHILETQVLPVYIKAVIDSSKYTQPILYWEYLSSLNVHSGICFYLKCINEDASIVFGNNIKSIFLYNTPQKYTTIRYNVQCLKWRINYMHRFIKKHADNPRQVRQYRNQLPF